MPGLGGATPITCKWFLRQTISYPPRRLRRCLPGCRLFESPWRSEFPLQKVSLSPMQIAPKRECWSRTSRFCQAARRGCIRVPRWLEASGKSFQTRPKILVEFLLVHTFLSGIDYNRFNRQPYGPVIPRCLGSQSADLSASARRGRSHSTTLPASPSTTDCWCAWRNASRAEPSFWLPMARQLSGK